MACSSPNSFDRLSCWGESLKLTQLSARDTFLGRNRRGKLERVKFDCFGLHLEFFVLCEQDQLASAFEITSCFL